MMKLYGEKIPEGMAQDADTVLILNQTSPLILSLAEKTEEAEAELCAKEIFTLATMAQRPLTAEEMQSFFKTSYELLSKLLGNR